MLPVAFILFAATLVGVALFARRSLEIAAAGLVAIALARLAGGGFDWLGLPKANGPSSRTCSACWSGSRWSPITSSPRSARAPAPAPAARRARLLRPSGARLGPLRRPGQHRGRADGRGDAKRLFPRIHPGYAAGIVAAANAGGAGSVIGDTTTTMCGRRGSRPRTVLPAYLGALVAFVSSGLRRTSKPVGAAAREPRPMRRPSTGFGWPSSPPASRPWPCHTLRRQRCLAREPRTLPRWPSSSGWSCGAGDPRRPFAGP